MMTKVMMRTSIMTMTQLSKYNHHSKTHHNQSHYKVTTNKLMMSKAWTKTNITHRSNAPVGTPKEPGSK